MKKLIIGIIIGAILFSATAVLADRGFWFYNGTILRPILNTWNIDIGSGNFTTTGTISDGVLTISDGSITSAVNGTFSGTLQAEQLTSTDDATITDLLSGARAHFTATSETMDTLRLKATTSIGSITFTGTGDDDMSTSGTYIGTSNTDFYVEIDGTGNPNTFKWSNDGGGSFEATGVAITKAAQSLENDVSITFVDDDSHNMGDKWEFTANAYSGNLLEFMNVSGNVRGYATDQTLVLDAMDLQIDSDTKVLELGEAQDFRIRYDGSNAYIENRIGGALYIENEVADEDLIFRILDGAQVKSITWDADVDKLKHSAGTFDFDDDNITTTGLITSKVLPHIYVAANDSSAKGKAQADYVADGTSDEDTINSALTAGAGGKVILLEGTYTIDGAILVPSDTTLEGSGYGTFITIASGVNGINMVQNSDVSGGNNNIRIANLRVDGTDTQAATTSGQSGVWLQKVTNSIVEDVWVENLGRLGVPSSIGILLWETTDTIVTNNIITDVTDGINTAGSGAECYRLVITNNVINSTNRDYGINLFHIYDSIISNNTIRESFKDGIFLNTLAQRNLITNNQVENNGRQTDNTYNGIILHNNANIADNTISHNIIRDAASGNNQQYGIAIGSNAVRNKIYFNDLKDSGQTGDYIDAGTDTIAVGNVTTSVANVFEILDTGTQLRLAYDTSNYFTFTTQSDGDLTLDSNKASYDLDFGDGNLLTTGSITSNDLTLTEPGSASISSMLTLSNKTGAATELGVAIGSGFSKTNAGSEFFNLWGPDVNTTIFGGGVTDDDYRRYRILADGKMWWGSGAANVDTNLYRSAANTLKTDDSLDVAGNILTPTLTALTIIVGTNSGAEERVLTLQNNATAANTATALKFTNSTSVESGAGSEIVSVRTDSPSSGSSDFIIRTSLAFTLADRFKISPNGAFTFTPSANTDLVMNFVGTTNSGILTWMEDEDYFLFDASIFTTETMSANSFSILGDSVLKASDLGATNNTGGLGNTFLGIDIGAFNANNNNTFIGFTSGKSNTSAAGNTFVGYATGYDTTTGGSNTFIGNLSGNNVTEGTLNTFLGATSGNTLTTGNSNVFIGNAAGYYETGSNKLFIDNQTRTNEATSRTNSLIYGVFNATVASQSLTMNAGTFNFNGGTNNDIVLNFTGTTNSGLLTWMEDENQFDFANEVVLKGDSLSLYQGLSDDFKQYYDGNDQYFDISEATANAGTPDIIMKLQDNAGASSFWINDSDDEPLFGLTSDGGMTVVGNAFVWGAIYSGTLVVDSSNDGAGINVNQVNTIFINALDDNISINDFTGGSQGQILHVVIKDNTNQVTFVDTSGANQEMYLHAKTNLVISAGDRGGITIICDGSDWYDVSHAKHVP